MLPILAGALAATIVLHLLGFTILNFLGAGLDLLPFTDKPVTDDDRVVALVNPEDEEDEPLIEPPKDEPAEVIPVEDITPPDLEDLPFEELVIAPGETDINLNNNDDTPMEQLSQTIGELNIDKVKAGLGEPVFTESLTVNDNIVQVKSVKQPNETDPDAWYRDQLKGAGGNDDSNLPDGSKTLSQLLAMPGNSLGKGSGYSRLGADLMFEYNQAVLKNSARIGLLQLAALMYKNPKTIFIIEGHTDSFGSQDYNSLLSLMRANAVREWLKDNGIALDHVYIRPMGNSRPVVAVTGDKAKQAANRRVEIHMRKAGEEIPGDVLPASYKVDMKTPIAKQLAANTNVPKPPAPRPSSSAPAPDEGREVIPQAVPVPEDPVPVAEPVE